MGDEYQTSLGAVVLPLPYHVLLAYGVDRGPERVPWDNPPRGGGGAEAKLKGRVGSFEGELGILSRGLRERIRRRVLVLVVELTLSIRIMKQRENSSRASEIASQSSGPPAHGSVETYSSKAGRGLDTTKNALGAKMLRHEKITQKLPSQGKAGDGRSDAGPRLSDEPRTLETHPSYERLRSGVLRLQGRSLSVLCLMPSRNSAVELRKPWPREGSIRSDGAEETTQVVSHDGLHYLCSCRDCFTPVVFPGGPADFVQGGPKC
ncbi:hypothetical protein R1flu_028918 [Riccia fluitans]|uniref:Uncharacterized protein n=1 Tax=Riccia fluitans TaxID=41844 RepID=A0ABD1XNL6_9MARC